MSVVDRPVTLSLDGCSDWTGAMTKTNFKTSGIFPFVVGCARSGTTLLRAMLDSHPDLAVPPESHFIPKMIGPPADVANELADDPNFRNWGIPIPDIRVASSYADAVRMVYAAYAASANKPRYADKTPAYVLHIPLIAQIFPESCFLHIIRDGRDTALSLVQWPSGPDSLQEAALRWRRYVVAGRLAGARLVERYMEVRYEELIDDPESTLRAVCAYLRLDYAPAMLDYPDRIGSFKPHASADDHLRHRPMRTRGWRDEMTLEDVATFHRLAGDTLVALGYDLSSRANLRQAFERMRARAAAWKARRRAEAGVRRATRSSGALSPLTARPGS
jgi:Sulfotransferase family